MVVWWWFGGGSVVCGLLMACWWFAGGLQVACSGFVGGALMVWGGFVVAVIGCMVTQAVFCGGWGFVAVLRRLIYLYICYKFKYIDKYCGI